MDFTAPRRRLIRSALAALRAGRSVCVIAHPPDESVAIARAICATAKHQGIPCRNVKGTDPSAPAVRARAYGQAAAIEPRHTPMTERPMILIDLSASFERGCIRESAYRTVFT